MLFFFFFTHIFVTQRSVIQRSATLHKFLVSVLPSVTILCSIFPTSIEKTSLRPGVEDEASSYVISAKQCGDAQCWDTWYEDNQQNLKLEQQLSSCLICCYLIKICCQLVKSAVILSNLLSSSGTSVRPSSGCCSGVVVRAVDCWQTT